MIIGKFKTNHPFLFGLLIIIAIVFWLDGFFFFRQTELYYRNSAPLYLAVSELFLSHKFISVLASFFFMLLQAFMFNRVIADKNIVDRNSWLPALMYIVLMSSSFNLFGLQPIWFANFFMIIALNKVFEVFNEDSVNIEIFNVGLFISLASLFYYPAILFFILLIAALVVYFQVNLRGILASLAGIVLPWIFVILYYYWFDQLDEKLQYLQGISINFDLFSLPITPYGWASTGVIGMIGITAVIRLFLGTLRDKPIRIRKRLQILLIYLLISILSIAFAGSQIQIHHGIIVLPLAGIIAGFFQENRRALLGEILFSLLLLLLLVGKLARV